MMFLEFICTGPGVVVWTVFWGIVAIIVISNLPEPEWQKYERSRQPEYSIYDHSLADYE